MDCGELFFFVLRGLPMIAPRSGSTFGYHHPRPKAGFQGFQQFAGTREGATAIHGLVLADHVLLQEIQTLLRERFQQCLHGPILSHVPDLRAQDLGSRGRLVELVSHEQILERTEQGFLA
jgi:hypothetical protein